MCSDSRFVYSMGLSIPNQHDTVLSSDRPTDFLVKKQLHAVGDDEF